MLDPLLFILYNSEILELVENRLFTYADDSTLLAVVRKLADRPDVAAPLNRELAKIQEWCDHRCMILKEKVEVYDQEHQRGEWNLVNYQQLAVMLLKKPNWQLIVAVGHNLLGQWRQGR